jgi:Protein of unknwon function (DUF3008)
MPAKSKKQQKLFGMALSLERGKMPKSKASKKVKDISAGMSEEEIKKYAKTKRKGLKENHVLSFSQFINEDAYIDSSGELQDLEFTQQDKQEHAMFDEMMYIVNFLEDAGAKKVDPDYFDGMMKFSFKYAGENYEIFISIDDSYATLMKYASPLSKGETMYDGSADSFFDLLKYQGLSFL